MNSTLTKGLQVMELLAVTRGSLGVTDIATRLSLGKSVAYRLLQTLVAEGYVRQAADDSSYRISTRVWQLGSAMMGNLDLRELARGPMQKLLAQTRETVALVVPEGREVVYVQLLESPQPVRAHVEVGGRAQAHCVSSGKAILAAMPSQDSQPLIRKLERRTSATITRAEDFLREMAAIRSRGWAVNRGEWRDSIFSVGAALVDGGGKVLGGISVSGPAQRLSPRLREFGEYTRDAARAINAELALPG